MLSKNQNMFELESRETSLLDVMNSSDTPKVRFMSNLNIKQLQKMIRILNQEECKIYIFKFLHDLSMIYGSGQDPDACKDVSCDGHGQYLSNDFFEQISLLRCSCSDFEGL